MSTLKFGSDYQACAHAYAYANKDRQGENYGNRMFYENDIMYSYGYHFIIAKKIRNKNGGVDFVLFNTNSASNTTSKQQWIVRRALYQRIVEVSTDIKYFNVRNEIDHKEKEIYRIVDLYSRARAEHVKQDYLDSINQLLTDIEFLAKYYRVKSKLPQRIKDLLKAPKDDLLRSLGVAKQSKSLSDARKEAKAERQRQERYKKEIAEEKIKVGKWKNGEIDRLYLRHTKDDYLRVSEDKQYIETSQGNTITVTEAKRLLKLIERKKIIGATVDNQFKVTAFNGFLKVGCHNISKEEIERIEKQI